jgi:hypothetical protein
MNLDRKLCSLWRLKNDDCIGEWLDGCTKGNTYPENSPRFGDRGSVLGASLKRVRKLTEATFE